MNFFPSLQGAPAWLADMTLLATAVLAAAAVICRMSRRMAAARKHFLLALSLAAIPALMLGSLLMPGWSLIQLAAEVKPLGKLVVEHSVTPQARIVKSEGDVPISPFDPFSTTTDVVLVSPRTTGGKNSTGWQSILTVVWIGGVLAGSLILLKAAFDLRRLRRCCAVEDNPRLRAVFREVSTEFGLALPDEVLRRGEAQSMPMTWGWRHPVVLLPAEAGDWDEKRLKLVLRHELAHIVRADAPIALGVTLSAILLWFHPLAWLNLRACHQAREQACDDMAMGKTAVTGEEFAAGLLEAVKGIQAMARRPRLPLALAMASAGKPLRRRLQAILDEGRRREPWSGKRRISMAAALAMLLALVSGLSACRDSENKSDHDMEQQVHISAKVFSLPVDSPALADLKLVSPNKTERLALIGIQSEDEVQKLMDALDGVEGVEIMGMPSVTTRNKQRATMEMVREFIFPTEFDPPQVLDDKTISPATPVTFEMRPVGLRMEFDPWWKDGEGTMYLGVTAEITRFEGFINYGRPIESEEKDANGEARKVRISENVINQPIFHSLKTSTSVKLRDGEAAVFGGHRTTTGLDPALVRALDKDDEYGKMIPRDDGKVILTDDDSKKMYFFIIQAKRLEK